MDDWGLNEFYFSGSVEDQVIAANVPIAVSNDTLYSISRDLGIIQATTAPIVWAIGYTTDPAISYANESASSQRRRPYYKSRYNDDQSLVTYPFFGDVLVLISGSDH